MAVSIYEETKMALGFDPEAPGPSIEFEGWGELIPPPSLAELVERLANGVTSITFEWELLDAERTLRKISARDDTQSMPVIRPEGEPT